jgi:hypothetical protein
VQEVVGPANIASAVMALAGSSSAESLGMPIDAPLRVLTPGPRSDNRSQDESRKTEIRHAARKSTPYKARAPQSDEDPGPQGSQDSDTFEVSFCKQLPFSFSEGILPHVSRNLKGGSFSLFRPCITNEQPTPAFALSTLASGLVTRSGARRAFGPVILPDGALIRPRASLCARHAPALPVA